MENSNYKNKNIEEKYSNISYNLIINYISEPITKIVGGFKDKAVSFFNINTQKQTTYGRAKTVSKPKTQKQFEENKINSVKILSYQKRKKRKKL